MIKIISFLIVFLAVVFNIIAITRLNQNSSGIIDRVENSGTAPQQHKEIQKNNLPNEEINNVPVPPDNDKANNNTKRDDETSNLPHPHAGARFPNGTLGLVIDPSTKLLIKQKMPHREKSCKVDDAIDKVAFEVFKRIRTGVIKSKTEIEKKNDLRKSTASASTTRTGTRTPRILCMVYTHSGAHSRVQAIVNSWGKECDGFFAASNATDLSIGAINLLHRGPEAYGNMWQKIRSMWAYAHDNFLHDYDYFHIAGDDAYVVVDNMKAYLQGEQIKRLLNGYIDNISRVSYEQAKRWENLEKDQQRPLLLGVPLKIRNSLFPQGGGGYTLNREAVRLIGVEGGPLDTILADSEDPREDVFISSLLSEIGTFVSDTRDDTGAFRYIPYRPYDRARGMAKYPTKYNMPFRNGMDLFSKETVALHLKNMDKKTTMDEVIYSTYDILSGKCDAAIF